MCVKIEAFLNQYWSVAWTQDLFQIFVHRLQETFCKKHTQILNLTRFMFQTAFVSPSKGNTEGLQRSTFMALHRRSQSFYHEDHPSKHSKKIQHQSGRRNLRFRWEQTGCQATKTHSVWTGWDKKLLIIWTSITLLQNRVLTALTRDCDGWTLQLWQSKIKSISNRQWVWEIRLFELALREKCVCNDVYWSGHLTWLGTYQASTSSLPKKKKN